MRNRVTGVRVARRGVFFAIAAALFFVSASRAAVPYIADIIGSQGIERSAVRGRSENGDLRLLGTFKIFNPDTVPFYLWVSFENGGKFTHSRSGGRLPAIRLVDMELRYRDAMHRPIVKAFPGAAGEVAAAPAPRRAALGTSGGGRFGKKKPHITQTGEEAPAGRRWRGDAVEIAFWREDAQPYYEMELWGVLYEPDVSEANVPGSYVENIKFEIEAAR